MDGNGSVRLIDQINDGESKLWEAADMQQKMIEKETESQALIGAKEPITILQKDYSEKDSPQFYKKAKQLQSGFSHIRRVRGDGNCFYRAVVFAQFERLLKDKAELERFEQLCSGWLARLMKLGFPDMTTEDFCDTFVNMIQEVKNGVYDERSLLEVFNDEPRSNYIVMFMRLATSGYLQENEDAFQGFIEGQRTVREYCDSEVNPMYRECDHVCISALTQGLGIPIRIEYMDQSLSPTGEGTVHHHDMKAGEKGPFLHFLYRPGHYDILYPISEQ